MRLLSSLMIAVVPLAMAGCGNPDKASTASQVAAKVNKDEISVHQVNDVISRFAGLPADEAQQARSQILEKLIDQEVLVQKAINIKLDRDPKIMQVIEATRRQLLAQAYLERATASAPKPSVQEIKTFYVEHPQLFTERRIYRLQEVGLGTRDMNASQLESVVSKAKSIGDVTVWLKSQNVKFSVAGNIKAAEQLPLESLPKFHAAKDGQIFVVAAVDSPTVIVQILDSQLAPLSEQEATPYVEHFLQNQFRAKLAEKEVKELRDSAKVEYVGEFKGLADAAAARPVPASVSTNVDTTDKKNWVGRGISGIR